MVKGTGAFTMLLLSISLAVAAIPEALPALITIALARERRNGKKNALARKLAAVENIRVSNFICTDKTGTLTLNRMKVVETYDPPVTLFINPFGAEVAMVLNNDARTAEDHKLQETQLKPPWLKILLQSITWMNTGN
jgi:Ca2+-transporting ATPase